MAEKPQRWHAELWRAPKGTEKEWLCAMGGFVFPEEYLGEQMKAVQYGPLFAYMYRRFGMPEHGSDGYKEIANWYITTPDPNVALCVSPRLSGAEYSFGYALWKARFDDWRSEELKQVAIAALRTATDDLLCPVEVRVRYMNAKGEVPDDQIVVVDEEVQVVPYWKWAGYGVPHEYFEQKYSKPK